METKTIFTLFQLLLKAKIFFYPDARNFIEYQEIKMLTKCQSFSEGFLHVAIFLGHGSDVTGRIAVRRNHFD